VTVCSFEADLDPEMRLPRMRFNFANGWSASIVLRSPSGRNGCDFAIASVACCPIGLWQQGVTELGETEASADEVSDYLYQVSSRAPTQAAAEEAA
jgi:hypothetical protein